MGRDVGNGKIVGSGGRGRVEKGEGRYVRGKGGARQLRGERKASERGEAEGRRQGRKCECMDTVGILFMHVRETGGIYTCAHTLPCVCVRVCVSV